MGLDPVADAADPAGHVAPHRFEAVEETADDARSGVVQDAAGVAEEPGYGAGQSAEPADYAVPRVPCPVRCRVEDVDDGGAETGEEADDALHAAGQETREARPHGLAGVGAGEEVGESGHERGDERDDQHDRVRGHDRVEQRLRGRGQLHGRGNGGDDCNGSADRGHERSHKIQILTDPVAGGLQPAADRLRCRGDGVEHVAERGSGRLSSGHRVHDGHDAGPQ